MLDPLPQPAADALAVSRALSEQIAGEVGARGGWISFARYMELALYAPLLGYYTGGAAKLGKDGDFTTAPEMTPLFGRALARQIAQILETAPSRILEIGGGSGGLAADLLLELEFLRALPERYSILDLSPDFRDRQKEAIRERAPHLLDRVAWLDSLPETIEGAVIGNEVLDAMPVHLVVKSDRGWNERGVTVDSRHGFVFADRALAPDGGLDADALDAALLNAVDSAIGANDALTVGYTTEIGLAASGFIAAVADRLAKGVALFIDYGFPRREYYHPQRHAGTLMMHYRHHAHADPFFRPGLTDITAHVDFSAASNAALRPGAELLGYASQANFLINCRITDLASASFASSAENPAAWAVQASALQKLLSEAEMGELFKVIAFGRKIDEPLIGFSRGDRSGSL